MKETQFIEQNKEKWAEYEEMLRQKQRNPERLNELFIQITDDLSYARTFYPNRSVRLYLNGLAQRIFHNIYRGKRFPVGRLWQFWADEIPRLYWLERRAMWLSFGVFLLSFVVGVVSSRIDPDFARTILGDSYVDMTEAYIESGDPMAVYKEHEPLSMSVGIAANNLFVMLRTVVFGVPASIGTLFILMYNGIMVGVFQYFFIERGVFWQSFLTIWVHGTLEISAIVLSGAAGLVMGSGLLFPGTYTRMQAFQISMRRGLKMFIGLTPMVVLTAFFEGFLTRFTGTPDAVRFLFIVVLLFFVLGYFVWLPRHKARKGLFENADETLELPPDRHSPFHFAQIKRPGEVFADAFTMLKRHGRLLWITMFAAAAMMAAVGTGLRAEDGGPLIVYFGEMLGTLNGLRDLFGFREHRFMMALQAFITAVLCVGAFAAVSRRIPERERPERFSVVGGLSVFVSILLLTPGYFFLFQFQQGVFGWLLAIAVAPLLALWAAVMYFEEHNLLSAIPRTFQIVRWSGLLTLGFLVVNLGVLLLLFLDSSLWQIVQRFFSWLVPAEIEIMDVYTRFTTTFAALFFVYFTFVLSFLSGAFQYFSFIEIADARHLYEEINEVGAQRQIRGLARE